MDVLALVLSILVVGTFLLSVVVLRRLDTSRGPWREHLEARYVRGIPWGTLVVTTLVLGVYLFVQDGITDFQRPVTIPFRAWSYLYPLGVATASFSHAGPNHLAGNLAGTLVLAPIAEYFWGHYPDGGSDGTTASDGRASRVDGGPGGRFSHWTGRFAAWSRNPWVRALVVFPMAVIAVGLVTSVFALGPVIGFSGVVFAFAGFAIVRYPIATVVAAVGGQSVVVIVYRALRSPIFETVAESSPPAPPSWATIAIQGHALGFFVGVLLGIALLRRRRVRPDPVYLWIAVLVFGFGKALWAIYWFGSGGTYVLFQGPGVVIVVALTLLVTVAITASDRPILPVRGRSSGGPDVPSSLERALDLGLGGSSPSESRTDAVSDGTASRIRSLAGVDRTPGTDDARFTRRGSALVAVLLVVAVVAAPALVFNVFVVDPGTETEPAVTVEDYAVTYDESVENQLVSIVPVGPLGAETTVETSGVIVWSEERQIWTDPVSSDRLAFDGDATLELGGVGWRTTVAVDRVGWDVVGNESAYQVWIEPDDGTESLAYASGPVRSDVEMAGNEITVVPDDDAFVLEVTDGTASQTVDVPDDGESVEANGVTFTRDGDALYAAADGSRAMVASVESP